MSKYDLMIGPDIESQRVGINRLSAIEKLKMILCGLVILLILWLLIISTIMIYTYPQYDDKSNDVCGYGYMYNNTCICFTKYAKFKNYTCDYPRKSGQVALLLQLLFPFSPVGAIYGKLYVIITMQILFLIIILTPWLIFYIRAIKKYSTDFSFLILNLIITIFGLFGGFVIWIYSVVAIGLYKLNDNNGIAFF